MTPFQEFNSPQQRQRYIKKGRIHSQKALKRRAEDWIEKWSSISGISNRVFRDHSLNDGGLKIFVDESSYSLLPEYVKGFERKVAHEGITVYWMTRDHIENLEMEENLTTDEEDDEEEEIASTPVLLSIECIGNKLKLCSLNSKTNSLDSKVGINAGGDIASSTLQYVGNVNDERTSPDNVNVDTASQLSSDENLSPNENHSNRDDCDIDEIDPDAERTRPVSRISLVIPPYGDDDGGDDLSDCESERPLSRMSRSGYMSYFETEYEDDDDNDDSKKVVKARKPGKGVYGKIPGINVGTVWKSRRQFSRRSVHRSQNAIIHGGPKGAYSMVLSASYSVNDRGEEFDFYGEGGRDQKTKKHVRDQRMERGNLSLRENIQAGTPVRVIRGYQLQNMYAPEIGYRYDGLYEVTQCTIPEKIDGYQVFMFTFARCGNQQLPPWHTSKFDMPLPSPNSVDHHLSDSDDDVIPENERLKRPTRKKRRRTSIPEISRSSTPLSCASDDLPPELHLPEKNVECPIVYPIPPRLSPSLSISNGVLDIQKRPVLLLQKLDKDIFAEAVMKPINVKDVRLFKQKLKKIKTKQKHGIEILKKKRKYTFKKNKAPTVNANILKKEKKKIKSVKGGVVTTAKINFNKKFKHSQNKTKHNTKKQPTDQTMKKKQGRPKVTLVTKKNTSVSDVEIKKKRGRPKMSLIKKTNVNGPLRKVSTNKNLTNESVKKKRGRPKGTVNDVKKIKTKKHEVAFTQKKTTDKKTSEKKKKKIVLKEKTADNKTNEKKKIVLKEGTDSDIQGKEPELPHSYPGKKRGRKRKITE